MNNLQNNNVEKENNMILNMKISKVFNVLKTTFELYRVNEVFLSFNGGKDCTVLLDLLNKYLKENKINCGIRVIYMRSPKPFRELEDFIDNCEKYYGMKIEKIDGKPRTVLEKLCTDDRNLKAVIMGSRRTDPYCRDLETMKPTDPNWPALMRINPILDWTFDDIWKYLLWQNVPYCKLYDEGYTSIGDMSNTKPNPHLRVINPETGAVVYEPAYKLLDESLERVGRS